MEVIGRVEAVGNGAPKEGGGCGELEHSEGTSAFQLSLAYLQHSRSALPNLPDFQEKLGLQRCM